MTDTKEYRADQMLLLMETDGWKFYAQRLQGALDDVEVKILGGQYKTIEDYAEACGQRAAYKKALRIPALIRNEAGFALDKGA